MAKDRNTFLKRQREMEKKRKAEEKKMRRRAKKEKAASGDKPDVADDTLTEER